jgi:hypothetical protein
MWLRVMPKGRIRKGEGDGRQEWQACGRTRRTPRGGGLARVGGLTRAGGLALASVLALAACGGTGEAGEPGQRGGAGDRRDRGRIGGGGGRGDRSGATRDPHHRIHGRPGTGGGAGDGLPGRPRHRPWTKRGAGREVVEAIAAEGVGSAEFHAADLASLAEVRALARAVRDRHPRIHILVNNAGIWLEPEAGRVLSEDGHELHFQVNYLSHVLLTRELLPLVRAAGTEDRPARILHVSSVAQRPIDFDDVMMERTTATGVAMPRASSPRSSTPSTWRRSWRGIRSWPWPSTLPP